MKLTDTHVLFACACVMFILISNYAVEMVGRWHFTQTSTKEPFDIFHSLLPDFHSCRWIVNIIPLTLLALVFLENNTLTLLKEAALFFGLVMLIRALTTLSTILPKHEKCVEPDLLYLMLGGGCYDKIFSGHMSFVTIFTLVLLGNKNITVPTFALINLAQALVILVARTHYSVDVILGFIISYFVYDGDYHLFTNFLKGLPNNS